MADDGVFSVALMLLYLSTKYLLPLKPLLDVNGIRLSVVKIDCKYLRGLLCILVYVATRPISSLV